MTSLRLLKNASGLRRDDELGNVPAGTRPSLPGGEGE